MVVVVVAGMEPSSYNIPSRPWPFAAAEECVQQYTRVYVGFLKTKEW